MPLTATSGARFAWKRSPWWITPMLVLAATAWADTGRAPATSRGNTTIPAFFPVRVLWGAAFGVAPEAPPVVDAGQLYVTLRSGRLVALSMDRVAYVWNVPLDATGPLAIEGGRLFVPTAGAVEALDTATGTSVWRKPIGEGTVAGLLATAGWVFLSYETGDIFALRADSGEQVWTRALGTRLSAPPVVVDDRVFAGTEDGAVHELDVRTGDTRWVVSVDGAPTGLGVRAGRLYFGTTGKQFYCLRSSDGFVEWRWRIGATIVGEPGFDDRHVFLAALDNQVRALDQRSGAQRWRKPLPARPVGGPLALGPSVIVPLLALEVRVFAAKDGANQGRYAIDAELNTLPAIVARPLSRGGDVLALVLSDGSALGLQRRVEPPLAGLGVLPGLAVPLMPVTPSPAVPPVAPPR